MIAIFIGIKHNMELHLYFNPKKDLKKFEQYWQESERASNNKNFESKRALV